MNTKNPNNEARIGLSLLNIGLAANKFIHERASTFMSGYENTAIGCASLNFSDMKSRGIAVDFVDLGCGYGVPQFRNMTDEERVAANVK